MDRSLSPGDTHRPMSLEGSMGPRFERNRHRGLAVLWIVCVLGGAGCIKDSGSFTAGGFEHETYPYRVVGAGTNILGANWRLDHFRRRKDRKVEGKPTDEYLSNFSRQSNEEG